MRAKEISTLLLCSFLVGSTAIFCNKEGGKQDQKAVMQVKTIINTPKKYLGKNISIAGNVYATDLEKKQFMIVDFDECDFTSSKCNPSACKVTSLPVTCPDLALPVKGAKVIVKGKISQQDGRFTFHCKKIEKYRES